MHLESQALPRYIWKFKMGGQYRVALTTYLEVVFHLLGANARKILGFPATAWRKLCSDVADYG